MSLQSMLSVASSAATRVFTLTSPGQTPMRVADGDISGSITLEEAVKSGTGKWMYDETARSFGFKPQDARNNPDKNEKVMTRLGETINTMIAQEKAGKGIAGQHSDFRSALTQATRAHDSAATAQLNASQMAAAALPGAKAFSNPALQTAIAAELKVASKVPGVGKAAQVGSLAGQAGAVAIAGYNAASGEIGKIPASLRDGQATPAENKTTLSPAAAALDTNEDGKLQCSEIGVFVPEMRDPNKVNANAYQDFISKHPGMDFHVSARITKTVKFDGCDDRPDGAVLLEAKADHGNLLGRGWSDAETKNIPAQGERQDKASKSLGVPNEWHTQTSRDQAAIERIFLLRGLTTPVIHTPMNPSDK